jgi:AcrR family transcriptional regulator
MTAHQTTLVRRIEIVEAAGRLISKYGSENLTIKGLASEVGLSDAAIYRHFRSKRDILVFLADQVGETLVHDIDDAAYSERDSVIALESALDKHLSSIARRRGISFQVISEIVSLGDRELNEHAYAAITKYVARLERLLTEINIQGSLKTGLDIRATAQMISTIIQGLVNFWVLSNYSMDLKAEFMSMWRLLSAGLAR